MIEVHRLNGQPVVVNAELIESVEAHPDTVIVLATGNRIVVTESVALVISRVIAYRKMVYVNAADLPEFLQHASGLDEQQRPVDILATTAPDSAAERQAGKTRRK